LFESIELNEILKSELALGNEIAEESAWLPKCKKLIILTRRFHHSYDLGSLEYRNIKTPHDWYAQYSTSDQAECLACK
jgi:hypothetical protein